MQNPKTVDEYVANKGAEARIIMQQLREIITLTVPEVVEQIAWNVPIYKLNGVFVGFAAYSKHISLGFGEKGLNSEERDMIESEGYKTGKGTVQIRFGQEVPLEIIKKILITHAKINSAKVV